MLWEDWFSGFRREKGCKRENVDSSVWPVHIMKRVAGMGIFEFDADDFDEL